jgi:hypothetical protein
MTHPDRNLHVRAKEAFQRLLNSKWKLKYSKLLGSSNSTLLTIENRLNGADFKFAETVMAA